MIGVSLVRRLVGCLAGMREEGALARGINCL